MKQEIVVADDVVCVVRKYRNAKCARIIFSPEGAVTLSLPRHVSYERGKQLLENRLEWIREKRKVLRESPKRFLFRGSLEEYRERKEEAHIAIEKLVEYFQKVYGVRCAKVSIRNQKTRFGSCSRNGTLSFHYRLLFLPKHLREYVIVHEICHLLEFNHSSKFWQLVGKTFPDYPLLRRELRLL
ncbi:MAG: DUF45 domain-containing protein [Candidatus Moranbacteria bacterium]|nr:DUF45 domain-containing protein [Candidatus Moranbacteria bacterium]